MKKQTHHIQKQQLILDFPTEEKARHWNKRFSAFYHSEIHPPFSSLLDKYVPGDRSYVVDRLEIDLGTVRMDEFRTAFLKKTEAELKRTLKNGSAPPSLAGRAAGAAQEGYAKQAQVEHTRQEGILRIKDRKEHLLETFYYFLDHGILPWNSEFKGIAALETKIRQQIGPAILADYPGFQKRLHHTSVRKRLYFQFSKPFAGEIFNRLYKAEIAVITSLQEVLTKTLTPFARNVSSRKKIRAGFPKNAVAWIGTAASGEPENWPLHFIQWVVEKVSFHVKSAENTALIRAVVQEIPSPVLATQLKALYPGIFLGEKLTSHRKQSDVTETTGPFTGSAEHSGQKLFDKENLPDQINTLHESAASPNEMKKQVAKEPEGLAKHGSKDLEKNKSSSEPERPGAPAPGKPGDSSLPPGFRGSKLSDDADEPTKTAQEAQKPKNKPGLRPGSPGHSDSMQFDKESLSDHSLKAITPVSGDLSGSDAELEAYYLRHAGIILSWPYLARLFQHLGYLDDQTFKETRYQERAVHLLGYIASGQERREEQELVMAKFLCAWPLQMPIIKELELSGKEKEEANQMLNSLIVNWSALKNTSIEGLRSSFFSREGKLFREEDEQWRLIVEQQSYDMLLDRLPYTIGIIKLPWMKNMLKVDWA